MEKQNKLRSIEMLMLFTNAESFEVRFFCIKVKALEYYLGKHPSDKEIQQLYTLPTEKGKYILQYKTVTLGVITIEREKNQPILLFDPVTLCIY